MVGWHPLGRVGEVHDASEAVDYLATAPFVSGTVLNVDGGFRAWPLNVRFFQALVASLG